MDFRNMTIATLTRGVSGEGERYLELFLRVYSALFPGPLNPQCPRCLNQYLQQYKNHMNATEPTANTRLVSPDDTGNPTYAPPEYAPGIPLEGDELFEPNTPV